MSQVVVRSRQTVKTREQLDREEEMEAEREMFGMEEDFRRVFPRPAVRTLATIKHQLDDKLEELRIRREMKEVWE